MTETNHITKVAIVGAGGNSGKFMTEALLKTGKHTVTAITRANSQAKLPEGVIAKQVDYEKPETLVEALRDQDALVITLSGYTPKDTEGKLIHAAGEAGVKWILPNEWSPDTANEALVKDVFMFQPKVATRQAITALGKSSYIAVSTGFWYEWSLAVPAAFGIDFAKRSVTYFDEGETKISSTTLAQVGRAVAALLSLPIKRNSDTSNDGDCLDHFRNQVVYVNSFTITQKDMFQSALRVTGTTEDAWSITKESSSERYTSGLEEIKEGKRIGYAKMMYTRVFYPDGCGDFETGKGTLNALLGLPKEDIDQATMAAMERAKTQDWVSKG